jgi:three-Cys-motif partner protein
MSKELGTIWEIPPHTKAKHEILRYYLGAWFSILASVHLRLLCVDGFAGPGEYKGGEDGSPIIALKVARDHTLKQKLTRKDMDLVFYFIEKEEARYQNLERKVAELKPQLPSNFRIEPRHASFKEIFDSILSQIEEQNKQLAPSFVFIDPFGSTGFPMSLISRLAQQPSSEVLVTFNYQSLNEWFLRDPRKHKYLDELYGSDVWRRALKIADTDQKERYLMNAYQKALESLGWKGRSFRMMNKQNQTQYYLFFATRSWRGMLAMKRAMWHAAPTGDFQYSDLSNPQQPHLFDRELYDEEYSKDLAEQIYQSHGGQSIPKQTLERNDLAWHTICIDRHLTRALRMLEYEAEPPRITEVERAGGKKCRRSNTYPDDCILTFAP